MKRALLAGAVLVACGPKTPEANVAPMPPDMPDPKPHAASKIQLPSQLVDVPLFVSDLDGYALFEDEQLQAANVIASWARAQGLDVVEPSATRQIFTRAAHGQHVETGQACGAPLWRTLAISRWRDHMKAKGRIEAGVYCTPTCWLDVRISLGLDVGLDDDGPTAFYAAPFDPGQPWAKELATRLDQLITWRAPGEPNDPIAQVPGAQPMPAVTDAAFDRDHDAQDTPGLPAALQPAAHQCLGQSAGAGFVVQTSASGAVDRCEPFDRRVISNVPASECICKAISGKPLSVTGRHALAVFGDDAKVLTKSGLVINASADSERALDPMSRLYKPVVSDRSVEEWESPQPWVLAPCFVNATTNIDANVKLEFARDGHVTKTDVKAATGVLPKDADACLQKVYSQIVAPCPDVDKATASGVVHVMLARP